MTTEEWRRAHQEGYDEGEEFGYKEGKEQGYDEGCTDTKDLILCNPENYENEMDFSGVSIDKMLAEFQVLDVMEEVAGWGVLYYPPEIRQQIIQRMEEILDNIVQE